MLLDPESGIASVNYETPRDAALIALTGAAGAGKSTAAAYLAERFGYQRTKFAGPLKDMMRAIGLGEAEIEGHLKEVPSPLLCGRTPRHAMQTLGTEWGRDCMAPDLWVSLWARGAAAVLDEGGCVVVEDCRFLNEAAAVQRMGGIIVKIDGRGGLAGGHASESQPLMPDFWLDNSGTVEALEIALSDLLESYGIGRAMQ